MHNFSILKSGGAVKLLPRRTAQRMVRYDTQSDCRRAEEVPHIKSKSNASGQFRVCRSRTNRWNGDIRKASTLFWRQFCKNRVWDNNSYGARQSTGNNISRWENPLLFRHACGGCNHLVTEVGA